LIMDGGLEASPKTSKLVLGTPLISTRTNTSVSVSSHVWVGVMKPIGGERVCTLALTARRKVGNEVKVNPSEGSTKKSSWGLRFGSSNVTRALLGVYWKPSCTPRSHFTSTACTTVRESLIDCTVGRASKS
jgi:hypothetical protein